MTVSRPRRKIAVVSVARSDYGIYLPVLRRIAAHPGLELQLIVGGMHLAPAYGRTVEAIEADGLPIAARVEHLLSSDSAAGVAASMGLGTLGYGRALDRLRPDLALVLGDRFEMHAAASAAAPMGVPLAHLHGGELTYGAIDELFRHSITKLSHLHFAPTEDAGRRIVRMGEEPWRVTVTGSPALDHLAVIEPAEAEELLATHGVEIGPRTLLVTYHPVTREPQRLGGQVDALLAALRELGAPVVFTYPNADAGGTGVRERLETFVAEEAEGPLAARLTPSLGARGYHGAMTRAAAMVGNSSSGIIEAPSFGLPVVNIGTRQEGRLRAGNVIDAGDSRQEIVAAVRRATTPEFRRSLAGLENPYGDGRAAERIVEVLAGIPIDDRLLRKRFYEGELP